VPAFVDANILVYAEDRDVGSKHTIARDLVAGLWRSGEGVLSVQVLQEFFVNITRKVPRPLSSDAALAIVEEYLTWRVVENTGGLLLAGIRLASTLKVSFWDALVLERTGPGGDPSPSGCLPGCCRSAIAPSRALRRWR
jgi:predicted nucleic acid-binding protein